MASVPLAYTSDQRRFEAEIATLRGEFANLAAHMGIDGNARAIYDTRIRQYASEIAQRAHRGEISWKAAAEEAHAMRQSTLQIMRQRSTPVGRALAESIKAQGPDLNTMVARKTRDLFGAEANFMRLAEGEKQQVYAAVVRSAGKSNPEITARMLTISRAGRALLVLSVAISVYAIATSDNPEKTALKEGAIFGAGVGGGIAGGAAAGLVCGPGAPVCSTIGAFIGGALAAFGTSYLF